MLDKAIADRMCKAPTTSNIRRILEEYGDSVILDPSENILKYWVFDASISDIGQSCRVVEQLFSGMRFILGTLRENMQGSILNDITVIRCNHLNTKRAEGVSKRSSTKQQKSLGMDQPSPARRTPSNLDESQCTDAGTEDLDGLSRFIEAASDPHLQDILDSNQF